MNGHREIVGDILSFFRIMMTTNGFRKKKKMAMTFADIFFSNEDDNDIQTSSNFNINVDVKNL